LLAYKVLRGGRSGFTGWHWPLPDGDRPGDWVCATGPLALCRNGIHASTVDRLPQWLDEDLWRIELDGEVLATDPALLAARARLVGKVDEWDEGARLAFCCDCAQRGHELAARYPAASEVVTVKIEPFSELGMAGPVAYWTALLAGQSASDRRDGPEYDVAFARERAFQARWLRRELGLTD
jgi:hypothetical protein